MNHVDLKAYALSEMNEGEKRSAEAHIASCETCREELAGVQVTLRTLTALRDEEMPRRIAFVSDKVFEPRWWQRMFSPAFASALVLAGAIMFHAFYSEAQTQARIDRAVAKEIQDRLVLFEQKDRQFAQAYMAAVGLERQ